MAKTAPSDRPRRTANLKLAKQVAHQRTLNTKITCTGVALHSGNRVTMALCPAEPDTGIVFVRTDLEAGGARIPARWDRVVNTRLCTAIGGNDGITVATIEHLMAAFSGSGIDNAVVELNGPEVPIMDGSAAPFTFLVECAGTVEQDTPRRAVRVLKAVTVTDDHGGRATLSPHDGFAVDVEIDFKSSAVSHQSLSLGLVNGTFKKELSRARTFGFLHEVEQLRAAGLARGGSLDNAIVISGDTVLNEGGLRYDNEMVRHKALDAIGDLYLAGGPLLGAFHGICSGHATNNLLLRTLFGDREAWSYDVQSADQALGNSATSAAWRSNETSRLSAAAGG